MFSLVIAIIAIALVAVLAGASIYYGSDAFQGNQSKARYAEIVNQAEQISNAFVAFRVQGNQIDQNQCSSGDTKGCLNQLVETNYLSAVPERNESGRSWDIDGEGALFTTTEDVEACIEANESQGYLIDDYPEHDNGEGVPSSESSDDAIAEGAICVENE